MTKLAVILFAALAASANAFAPPSQAARSSSALNAVEMESLRGGTGPETGGKMFDPLELSQWAPADFLRKAELANGRSAMLATVGWFFPKIWTFQGPVDTTDPVEAFLKSDAQWWAQFILFCGTIEAIKYRGEVDGKSYTGEVGKDAAIDWTGQWAKMSPEQQDSMATKELKNARLAMIGFAGFAAQTLIPGSVPGL
mmetsp:Transcript_55099/g.133872  ORF Transcript_55099/g.133872 Transcript_55099/m.133872 type:complete len:197 (+) Transcript_55099:200-790(+)